ncbi:MAG: glutathione S-transferase N-terminal domain-containing protein [Gammaproteobacteria bacterium]
MKLIGSLSSPYVRKVRILLAEKGIKCPLLLEDVWATDTTIQTLNPLGKVPCLILDDSRALYDSRVICEFLDISPPANSLIPSSFHDRIEVLRWEALADGVLDAGVLMRLEQTQRESQQRSGKWIERQRGKVVKGLGAMSQGLGESEWCVGARFTLADIATGCALGWLLFRLSEVDWQSNHPNLVKHYDKLMTRRSFSETAPK